MSLSRLAPVLILLLFASCIPLKKYVYLQDGEGRPVTGTAPPFEMVVKNGDILSVQLFTVNAEAFPGIASTIDKQVIDNRSQYEKGFVVDRSGMLELPLVGKIPVGGLPLQAARDTITARFAFFIEDPVVVVKKLNFKITVLGEVGKPGMYYVPGEQISFLEALGMAGDLTVFGNRKAIKVIRRTSEGYREIAVDLTTKEVLNAEVAWLHPDDVVYIPAVKRRGTATISPTVAVITSIVATLALVISVIFRETN